METKIQCSHPVLSRDLAFSNQIQTRKSPRALSWVTFLVSVVYFLLSCSFGSVHAHLNHTVRALSLINETWEPSIRPTKKPRLVFASRSPSQPGTKKPGPSVRPTKKPRLVFGSKSPSQPGTKKPGSPPRIVFLSTSPSTYGTRKPGSPSRIVSPSIPQTEMPTISTKNSLIRTGTKKPTVRPTKRRVKVKK